MATLVGTQAQLGSLLRELIELEYDAIEAYQAAVDRLVDATHKTALARFMADHTRHVETLTRQAGELGAQAPTRGDAKAVLAKGKVVLGGLVGDKAILLAMRTNEADTNTAYERATARTDLPEALMQIMQANLADERRHRAYIDEVLGTAKVTEAMASR